MGAPRIRRVDPPPDFSKFSCLSNLFLRFSSSSRKCGLFLSHSEQTLAASDRRQARATRELCAEWAQLEMQLVMARVAAAAAVEEADGD
jgi:hypothetical protein